MGGVIDTNILLYCANRDAEEQVLASAFLTRAIASDGPWFITEGNQGDKSPPVIDHSHVVLSATL